jgi:hypothetical protein
MGAEPANSGLTPGPLDDIADRQIASFRTLRLPADVRAQPSAPQFASHQSVIWEYRCPRPPGGTPILTRTGKRRSAAVIIEIKLVFSKPAHRPTQTSRRTGKSLTDLSLAS